MAMLNAKWLALVRGLGYLSAAKAAVSAGTPSGGFAGPARVHQYSSSTTGLRAAAPSKHEPSQVMARCEPYCCIQSLLTPHSTDLWVSTQMHLKNNT